MDSRCRHTRWSWLPPFCCLAETCTHIHSSKWEEFKAIFFGLWLSRKMSNATFYISRTVGIVLKRDLDLFTVEQTLILIKLTTLVLKQRIIIHSKYIILVLNITPNFDCSVTKWIFTCTISLFFSREKEWNLKCFHFFREVKSEKKYPFTVFEKWKVK